MGGMGNREGGEGGKGGEEGKEGEGEEEGEGGSLFEIMKFQALPSRVRGVRSRHSDNLSLTACASRALRF
jgi:hypothetical protein